MSKRCISPFWDFFSEQTAFHSSHWTPSALVVCFLLWVAPWVNDKRYVVHFLTSELSRQWNTKMKKPCSELQRAKRYWNAIVFLSNAKIPNNQVTPSKGKRTTVDLKPDLMMSIWKELINNNRSLRQWIVWVRKDVSLWHQLWMMVKNLGCLLDKIKFCRVRDSICLYLDDLSYHHDKDYGVHLKAKWPWNVIVYRLTKRILCGN